MGKTEIWIWPQHMYIFGIVSSGSLISHHKIGKIGMEISENWYKLLKWADVWA